jgi:hypothetical protein
MDTTRTHTAPRNFRGIGRPVAALPLAFLIATLFGISPIFAATTPGVASATSSGGFSSAPGMYPPVTSAASAAIVSVPGLPADRGTPSGGFSTALGMSPDTAVAPGVASASGAGVSGDPQVEPVSAGVTGAEICAPSGGFSSALGMSPDTSVASARTPCDPGEPGLSADLGTPSGGFSSAPGMSPNTIGPSAQTKHG